MVLGNTATRIIVSVIAIPAIVLSCYLGSYYFYVFVMGIGIISYYEFWSFVKRKDINSNLTIGIIAIGLIITNAFIKFIEFYPLFLILLIIITVTELFRNSGSAIINLGASLLGILYTGLFSSALLIIREFYTSDYSSGGFLIISLFASIWVCDSAAFFGGSVFGKHKLFPRVSPNKSWEGAVFGLLFAIFAMLVAKVLLLEFISWFDSIILGVIVGSIGQIGDLIESLFKRDAGVKDSSGIIPGHGGVFDRFDSLLYTAPAVLLYLIFFT
ncbi:phosphatidate cytidylyltransferase [Bacteroidota bacterium]